jgi:hypothetical protein
MKHTLIIVFIINFLTTVFTNAQTATSLNIDKVLKQLNIEQADCYNDLVAEEIMPYSKDKSVIVIPKIVEKDENSITCDSYVLVINNRSGKILNQYYEANALESDAVRIVKITIDFAPYRLNNTTRAFGIRVFNEGNSRPNPYNNEELSLFVLQDNVLVQVLRNFSVSYFDGEWDTQCEGEFVTENKVLIMSKNTTNNFFDIIVNNKITTTTKRLINNDCVDTDTNKTEISILHYDKKDYKL